MLKILIEIPTWLGDCVMATPAIENIAKQHPDAQITIFGSKVATEIFKHHPRVNRIIVDESRNQKYRLYYLYKIAKQLGFMPRIFLLDLAGLEGLESVWIINFKAIF
jgi:heptosyltransferase-2